MKIPKRLYCVTLLVACVSACGFKGSQTTGEQAALFPLFDVHFHYNYAADENELFSSLSAAHVTRTVLFGSERAAEMARKYPERFVASYSAHLSARRREAKGGKDEGVAKTIAAETDQALRSGLYSGIGEVSAYHHAYPNDPIAPDSRLILGLLEVAGRHGVPINIHCSDFGSAEMERALRAYPGTTVIWAHTGSHLPPDKIGELLRAHSNLYFDIAGMDQPWPRKHRLLSFFGRVDEVWHRLFEAFPDRFLIGFDISTDPNRGRRLSEATEKAEVMQQILSQLTLPTAQKLARENAERLYKVRK